MWDISAAHFTAFPVPVHTSLEQAGQLHGLDAQGEESKTSSLTPTAHVAFAQLHMENFFSHTRQIPLPRAPAGQQGGPFHFLMAQHHHLESQDFS